MARVVIADKLPEEIYGPLLEDAGISYVQASTNNLNDLLENCEALIVRSATKVNSSLIARAPNLRIVGRAGTGYDNIDLEAATSKGIVVENTPDGNTNSAAEIAITLMYAFARRIPEADYSLKMGRWERNSLSGIELEGKTLGVVGLGRIGRLVATRAKSLGMNILYYDPPNFSETPFKKTSLEDLLKRSDVVTLHLPAMKETEGLMGEKQFSLMKPTAYLVNAARGELVDEDALYIAISSGKIAGAAIDVFKQEPYEGKLRNLGSRVILTPHLGASTAEANTRVAEQITKQLIAYLNENKIENAVNVSTVIPELKPYGELIERMSYFGSKLLGEPISSIEVTCYGEITKLDRNGLSNYAIIGSLSDYIENINFVNSKGLARESGIEISDTGSPEETAYRNMISLDMNSRTKKVQIEGIYFEKEGPRIVGVNGYKLEFSPQGIILATEHHDQPGVLAHLTSQLADAGINISTSELARNNLGGTAMAILQIDSKASNETLAKIKNGIIYSVSQFEIRPPRNLL